MSFELTITKKKQRNLRLNQQLPEDLCMYVCVYMYGCVCVCVRVYVWVCMCMCVYVCVWDVGALTISDKSWYKKCPIYQVLFLNKYNFQGILRLKETWLLKVLENFSYWWNKIITLPKKCYENIDWKISLQHSNRNHSYLGMSFVTKLGALGHHMQFIANW